MIPLPPSCEHALLERFLKAEAMALWAVRAARRRAVPSHVRAFLARHERDEASHLQAFETSLGQAARTRSEPPRVPHQWEALAVQLFGYEALGLELARLLVGLRPDLGAILEDEEAHVGFFEREIRTLLAEEETAVTVRDCARAWWRRIPATVDRYLDDEAFAAHRGALRRAILDNIRRRFADLGLLPEGRNDRRRPLTSSPARQ